MDAVDQVRIGQDESHWCAPRGVMIDANNAINPMLRWHCIIPPGP
jgi:hypothetical protein